MLKTDLCGVVLKNPTVLASGIMGVTSSSLVRIAGAGAGAVTKKSIGPVKRDGHKNPTMVEVTGGYLNAMGLPTPGVEEALEEIADYKKRSNAPIIASFYGTRTKEYAEVAERLDGKPDLLEANISCPNVEHDFGRPFSADPKSTFDVVSGIKDATRTPLFVKLSPNVPNIAEIAKAAEDAGADGITAINTVGPGMAIDIKTTKPILTNKAGGMSGPAVKPVMVRCVYDIFAAVELPIIAVGGICTGEDAIEAIMAGAGAVGIGTALRYRGLDVFKIVCAEMEMFMKERGYSRLKDMEGAAHG